MRKTRPSTGVLLLQSRDRTTQGLHPPLRNDGVGHACIGRRQGEHNPARSSQLQSRRDLSNIPATSSVLNSDFITAAARMSRARRLAVARSERRGGRGDQRRRDGVRLPHVARHSCSHEFITRIRQVAHSAFEPSAHPRDASACDRPRDGFVACTCRRPRPFPRGAASQGPTRESRHGVSRR